LPQRPVRVQRFILGIYCWVAER